MSNRSLSMRRIIIGGVLVVAAYLLGFARMWLKARECSIGFPELKRQLRLAMIRNSLASAVIEARAGDYESALRAASDFFSSLRVEADAGVDTALSQSQRGRVRPLFAGRDELITLLAREDAASVDRLSDIYLAYSRLMRE